MKRILFLLLCAVAQVDAQTTAATTAVTKTITGDALTGNLTVPSGKTITVATGGTLTLPTGTLPIAATSGLQTALDTKAEAASLAPVAFSGNYTDLTSKPTIPAAQVQSDWNAVSGMGVILNKPSLAAVATTGNYSSLTGLPTLGTAAETNATAYDAAGAASTVQGLSLQKSSNLSDLGNATTARSNLGLGTAATYNVGTTDTSVVQGNDFRLGKVTYVNGGNITVGALYNVLGTWYISNPSGFKTTLGLSTVATSGNYTDLTGLPTIPAAQVNSDWNASSGLAQILNKPTLFDGAWGSLSGKPSFATVATSGNYTDLSNKPALATVATSGNYTDLTGLPTLGTAASTSSTAYATAAQGTKADNAGAVLGLVKSNGSATFTAATAGTDYLTPTGAGSGLASLPSNTALYPTLNQNTSGTAANLSGTPALPNGTTATTQAALDNSTKLATTGYADAADLSATAALLEREGLRFDGTASVTNSGIPSVGAGDFTMIALVNLFTPSPTLNYYILSTQYCNIYVQPDLAGGLVGIEGNINCLSSYNFPKLLPTFLTITRSANTITFYANGVSLGTAVSSGDPGTGLTVNYGSTQKTVTGIRYFNYALTQSEILALIRRGLVTLPEQRGGSMTAINTSAWTKAFGAGTITGASATGATIAASDGSAFIIIPSGLNSTNTYRMFYTVSGTGTSTIRFADSNGTWDVAAGFTNGTGYVDFKIPTAGLKRLYIYSPSSINVIFSSVSIIPLGTLFEQDSGQRSAGFGVRDNSGNNAHLLLPTSGVTIIDPASIGSLQWTTTASAYAYGISQQHIPTGYYIDGLWVQANGSVSLGSSPGVPTSVVGTFTPSGSAWTKVLDPGTSSTGYLYATLGTATTASFRVSIVKLP